MANNAVTVVRDIKQTPVETTAITADQRWENEGKADVQ